MLNGDLTSEGGPTMKCYYIMGPWLLSEYTKTFDELPSDRAIDLWEDSFMAIEWEDDE